MMDEASHKQNKLTQKIREFKINTKPRNPNMMKEKSHVIKMRWRFLRKEKWFTMVLRVEYFRSIV